MPSLPVHSNAFWAEGVVSSNGGRGGKSEASSVTRPIYGCLLHPPATMIRSAVVPITPFPTSCAAIATEVFFVRYVT